MTATSAQGGGITAGQGRALLGLARRTIAQALGLSLPGQSEGDDPVLAESALAARQGTFVTIEIHGALRGCIGNLVSDETIVDGVRRNAINAAFHDSRFQPLGVEEFPEIDIAVSVLTPPRPLSYSDGDDLAHKLRGGIDGVILRQGPYGATFLPQVWEQLPDPAEFLGHLCRKAMLPADAWRTGRLDVSVYQVQYFSEKEG